MGSEELNLYLKSEKAYLDLDLNSEKLNLVLN